MTYVLKALKLEYTLDSIERNMQTAKMRNVFNVLIEEKDFEGKKVYYCMPVILKRLHEPASLIVYSLKKSFQERAIPYSLLVS